MSFVQTVLGPISPNALGSTLTHEHVECDITNFLAPPPTGFNDVFEKKISLETIGYVRQFPYSSLENMRFCDEASRYAVKKDFLLYKKCGGGSIVENSSIGLKRNLELMVEIQKEIGINIIAGTGHYLHNHQSKSDLNMSVEELTDLYTKEITIGVDVPNVGQVKCGFIGEVGSEYPLHDFERRAIIASAHTQQSLGCGVSFHPGFSQKAPFEIVRLYCEAGGKPEKCVMSHVDLMLMDEENLLEFAKLGTYVQHDLFGMECSLFQFSTEIDMASDAQRIKRLLLLIEEGHLDQLLISHDVHSKHRLTSFGGHGYHHIQMNIIPRLLAKGLTPEKIEQITVKNPANWLELRN